MTNHFEIFCLTCGCDVLEDEKSMINCVCTVNGPERDQTPNWVSYTDALDLIALHFFSYNYFMVDRTGETIIKFNYKMPGDPIEGFNLRDR